jgi:hypothetical protein
MVISRYSSLAPDYVDRILLGVCAIIWLAVIGVGVAATVVLADLGAGQRAGDAGGSHTPWLLYAIIAISALIIVGAVPLLLRARRGGQDESAPRPLAAPTTAQRPAEGGAVATAAPGAEAPTQKLRVFGSIADPIDPEPVTYRSSEPSPRRLGRAAEQAVERIWLRATVLIACAMGAAMLAVTTATYLMGVDSDTAAWVFYGLAAVFTIAMPVIPLLYLRQLRATVGARRG